MFMIIGFQLALFVRQAAQSTVAAHRDRPDTVYVVDGGLATELLGLNEEGGSSRSEAASSPERTAVRQEVIIRRNASHTPQAQALDRRRTESFTFDPNTVSVSDLMRLGFSLKQAEAIDKYRRSGGRFRRPSDFARSYVVADSVYERLRPFIDIPKVDLNRADSAAFDALPGIGPYYARKMVEMRERLHGYSYPEQLMDIYNFDQERFDGLKDLISVSRPEPYPIWSLPEDSLALHPYIGRAGAHGVVVYRDNTPPDRRNVDDLETVLQGGMAAKLARCVIH